MPETDQLNKAVIEGQVLVNEQESSYLIAPEAPHVHGPDCGHYKAEVYADKPNRLSPHSLGDHSECDHQQASTEHADHVHNDKCGHLHHHEVAGEVDHGDQSRHQAHNHNSRSQKHKSSEKVSKDNIREEQPGLEGIPERIRREQESLEIVHSLSKSSEQGQSETSHSEPKKEDGSKIEAKSESRKAIKQSATKQVSKREVAKASSRKNPQVRILRERDVAEPVSQIEPLLPDTSPKVARELEINSEIQVKEIDLTEKTTLAVSTQLEVVETTIPTDQVPLETIPAPTELTSDNGSTYRETIDPVAIVHEGQEEQNVITPVETAVLVPETKLKESSPILNTSLAKGAETKRVVVGLVRYVAEQYRHTVSNDNELLTQKINEVEDVVHKLLTNLAKAEETTELSRKVQSEVIKLMVLLGFEDPEGSLRTYITNYGKEFITELLKELISVLNLNIYPEALKQSSFLPHTTQTIDFSNIGKAILAIILKPLTQNSYIESGLNN